MDKFFAWFNSSPFASMLRVAAALVVYSAISEWVKVGSFDFSNWQLWLIAGLASTLPTLLRWSNPADKSFDAKG